MTLLFALLLLLPESRAVEAPSCPRGWSLQSGVVPPQTSHLVRAEADSLLDCLHSCERSSDCRSFYFHAKSGCLLFSETQLPGGNGEGWKGERPCVEECGRPWSVQTVAGHTLVAASSEPLRLPANTTVECANACLGYTSSCKSAVFKRSEGVCELHQEDRHSKGVSIEASEEADYIESNCGPKDNAVCHFAPSGGRSLATVTATVDDVAPSLCRNVCLTHDDFPCRAFQVGKDGACLLSHLEEAGETVDGSAAYLMAACYQVSVECGAKAMTARIAADTEFQGKVYAKSRPNSCVADVHASTSFYLDLGFNDLDCDVRQESPGRFTSDIIIQHHDQIVTEQDVGLSIKCWYTLGNRSVGHGVELSVVGEPGTPSSAHQASFVLSPTVTMRITDRDGGDVHAAQVGDPLSLRFKIIDGESPYEILVRELIALDGVDSSQILLIDSEGCPTDPTVMGAVRPVTASDGSTLLEAPFDAFKFPTSDVVQFKALVTPCLPSCRPALCPYNDYFGSATDFKSYGRRKRSVPPSTAREEVVVRSIEIRDKFGFQEAVETRPGRTLPSPCWGGPLVLGLLAAAQMALCALSYTLSTKSTRSPSFQLPPPYHAS